MFDLVFYIALAPRSQTRIEHHRMTKYKYRLHIYKYNNKKWIETPVV